MKKTISSAGLTRTQNAEVSVRMDGEAAVLELSFSSEYAVDHYFGKEVLDHAPGSVRLDRLNDVGPLLLDHDPRMLAGKIERAWLEGRKGRATVRLAGTQLGQQTKQEIEEGIRTQVSVGYRIHRMVLESTGEEESDTYRVTDWEPFEISMVAVPADPNVGIGRNDALSSIRDIEVIVPDEPKQETRDMDPKDTPKDDLPVVDEAAIASTAAQNERSRISTIDALGKRFGLTELADKAVEGGWPVEEFRTKLLTEMGDRAPLVESDNNPDIGLTPKETQRYSMVRAMRALLNPNDRAAQDAAGFEFACSSAAASILRSDPKGLYVPSEVLKTPLDVPDEAAASAHRMMQNRWGHEHQRDLLQGTTTAGGYTVSTDVLAMDFIELLRNRLMVRQMGAQFITGLQGNVAFPSQTGGATAFWVAENGAPTESQQVFGQLAMSPETVGAYTDYSRRLLIQSSIDIEAFVRSDLASTIALALDVAAINGSGASNQPEGILNATGIGDVAGGTNGLAPTWAHMIELWTYVAAANADMGNTGFLMNAVTVGKLMTTEKASGTAKYVIENFPNPRGFTSVAGARAGVSNQVPSNLTKGSGTNLSAIIYGNWSDLIIGTWGALDLTLDPYTGSTSGTKRIVALQDCDIGLRHAASFSAMQDAITA